MELQRAVSNNISQYRIPQVELSHALHKIEQERIPLRKQDPTEKKQHQHKNLAYYVIYIRSAS